MCEIISKSELETKELAYKLASKLAPKDIVILSRRFRCWKDQIHRRIAFFLELAR